MLFVTENMLFVTEKFKYTKIYYDYMTSIEEHESNIKEFLEDINEKMRAGLLVKRQKIIAFSASEAASNILELYLHKKNLVSSGFRVNHRYFSSKKQAERFFDFEFKIKKDIIDLMIKQEELRNILCYGKEKKEDKVKEAINNVYKLKEMIESDLGDK